ncbi:MAG: DUF4956 domain-containing protein [Defluviitaleaceae bacterium]|nr:DUF4956 domain-containing protein [Defluviitaleaceae bacterium]
MAQFSFLLNSRFNVLQDIFNNPAHQILTELTPVDVIKTIFVAALCGILIFLTYRFFNRSVLYSENFNLLIIMLTVITAFIIITIGSNVILTLGMVGALSIVRFRAAVKDPLDVGFLFWGVASGLTAGAQLYWVALVGTSTIAALYILFTVMKFDKRAYLLIVRYGNDADDAVKEHLAKINYKLKNKTVGAGFTEITVELKAKKNQTGFVDSLKQVKYVDNVVMVEYTGDYA